ncbi:MAG: hypothetical protein ACXVKI_14530, partial [Flavisolibacter sp.]
MLRVYKERPREIKNTSFLFPTFQPEPNLEVLFKEHPLPGVLLLVPLMVIRDVFFVLLLELFTIYLEVLAQVKAADGLV